MNVTFILLGSSLFLRSVLRLIIFHNLKNISLVDHILKNETERERERAQNKTNRKEVWFDFHIRYRVEKHRKGFGAF